MINVCCNFQKPKNYSIVTGDKTKSPAAKSTFAIGGVSCSAGSLVVAESFVLHIKFSGKKPAQFKLKAKRYAQTIETNAIN